MDLTIKCKNLTEFVKNVFLKIGCPLKDAITASNVLISADLRGIDSHGVARLIGYIRLWENNTINTTPKIRITHETPSTAVIDGDAGLGLVVAPYAMKVATEKAKTAGTAWISVNNSSHFGIAGYHAMLPLENNMIGIAMTNASPLVAPTFSTERLLGTNPIAVAIPAGNQPPLVVDMATTTVANGKLEILARKNKKAPLGWIQKSDGNTSTNPNELKNGGALLPLGSSSQNGSHKGYALGAIVDIFSAVLSGANYGPWVPPFVNFLDVTQESVGKGIGHFFGVMRIDAFRSEEEFKNHIDNWINRFRNSSSFKNKKVLIPGDPERNYENTRKKSGIPLNKKVIDDLKYLAKKYEIEFLQT